MRRSRTISGGAFTLIEMLVVIAVIGILMGVTFRLMGLMGDADRAATVALLERIGSALTEYHSEYGQFPPTDRMGYEFENPMMQTPYMSQTFLPANPDVSAAQMKLFDYGLVAYLWPRDRTTINQRELHQWIPDTERDMRAKRRWARFLDGILDINSEPELMPPAERPPYNPSFGGQSMPYVNHFHTIRDPWRHELRYQSYPPFQSYRLWSVGPDGTNSTPDDIVHIGAPY